MNRSTCLSLWLAVSVLAGCSGTRPDNLGVRSGTLAALPETPNCVSTQTGNAEQRMAAWPLEVPADSAMTRLVAAVQAYPRSTIVEQEPRYLYVEFTSAFWRFVDDCEFFIDEPARLIHFRSAARLGRKDFGVNRARIEELWKLYAPALE